MADRPVYSSDRNVLFAAPLWLDTAFKVAFGPVTGWAFTGATLRLTLTHIETGTRFSFDESDFVLSDSDTVARLVKTSSWVRDNLVDGWYEGHFWVVGQDDHWVAFAFEGVLPAGGRVSP